MKNKILPILCIFILVSFLLISNCFAYTERYNNTTFWIADDFLEIAQTLPEYNEYDLVIFRDGFTTNDHMYIVFISSGGSLYDSLRYDGTTKRELWLKNCSVINAYIYSTDSFELISENNNFSQFTYKINPNDNTQLLYSEKDIYTDSSCTELFFQPPVLTLAMVLEKNSPVKTFQTMTSGMIPYLALFLVGLVAFWKAWQFLLKQLHKV